MQQITGLHLMVAPGDDLAATEKRAIGERLKAARGALSLTQKELCNVAGMKLPSLRDYELGNSVPGGEAVACLSRVGINANWLLTGEGQMLLPPPAIREGESRFFGDARLTLKKQPEAEAGYASIPLFDIRAAAGGGAVVGSEHVMDVLHFKEEWIRAELRVSPADLYLIFVDGESMEPTLRPGDIILVDRRDHAQRRDGIYVLRLDGTLLVKRLQKLPGGNIKVSSDNKSYDPFILKLEEMEGQDMAIIGRVVWVGRKV